jgi:hypothetical protein
MIWALAATHERNGQKFFGSFFQKRTASFLAIVKPCPVLEYGP